LALEFVEPLNVQILRIVEEYKIDIAYTHWIGDVHHDHQALARASLHSCRHVQRLLMYRSNWYHSPLDFRGTFFVEITQFWSVKERAIRAHQSEISRTHERWIAFFRNEAEAAGQRMGVQLAEVFEPVKWLA
jgi:LmbE family N-acetylglucosaminyl deacetylase